MSVCLFVGICGGLCAHALQMPGPILADLIFIVVAAVFMKCDIVLLDSATAMLRHVIVRCQRPNPRRQRSCARAQLRSDDGAMGAHLSGGEGRARTESALD